MRRKPFPPHQTTITELLAHSMCPPRQRTHRIETSTLRDRETSTVSCACGVTVTGANAASVAEAYRAHLGKG